MCSDIVEMRRADHNVQRLDLERERVVATAHGAEMKSKPLVIASLEALVKYAGQHPEACVALDDLVRLVRHPLVPQESNPIKPNQSESNLCAEPPRVGGFLCSSGL